MLEPGVFDYIDGDETQWEREPLERLAEDGQLMAYRHDSFWQCMDTLRDKTLLERLWESGQRALEVCGTESMRVLVTGHNGYIGSVLVPTASSGRPRGRRASTATLFGTARSATTLRPSRRCTRTCATLSVADLGGFDAVIHLAALSNDPLGDLDPELTYDINHQASVRLARLAKEAGVPRFLFSSSCSLYGAGGDDLLDRDAAVQPGDALRRLQGPRRAKTLRKLADD